LNLASFCGIILPGGKGSPVNNLYGVKTMISSKLQLAIPMLMIVAACAQPEPTPAPIYPEPVYDKWGNDISGGGGGCAGGQQAGGSANCIPQTDRQGNTLTHVQEPDGNDGNDGNDGGTGQ
jgi:hypothetical protein